MRYLLALLFLLTGVGHAATSFVKDPATADSLGASATVLNAATPTFTRTTSAYNPITDAIVGTGVRRQRAQVIGTTSYNADLIEVARTNLLAAGTSGRFDRWTANGTIIITADSAAAPDGEVIAQTLNDNDAAALASVSQTFTVANDSLSHVFTIYVLKTAGGTSPTFGVTLALTGGTGVTTNARINTDLGTQQYGSNANTSIELPANAAWYRIITKVTNNTTGNTTLNLNVYPAAAAYGASVDAVAATGSNIVAFADLNKAGFATSFTSNRNCLLQTEVLNTTWTKTRCTITSDSTANPIDGATNADTIVEDNTAANTHFIGQSFTKAAASIQFTYATYIKQSGRTWALVQCSDTGITNGAGIYFDVANGVKGTAVTLGAGWTLDASSIAAVGSWYRCAITVTTANSTTIRPEIYTATGDLGAVIAVALNSAALIDWGNQLVYGATAQTYWANTTASGLRIADTLTSTTTLGTSTGTLVALLRPYGWTTNTAEQTGSTTLISSAGPGIPSDVTIQPGASTAQNLGRTDAGGLRQITYTNSYANGVNQTSGMTYDATSVRGFLNGAESATPNTTASLPFVAVTSVTVGWLNASARQCDGDVLALSWSTTLPPSSMQIFANGVVP